jgi:DHA2 family multidrug resistance protein
MAEEARAAGKLKIDYMGILMVAIGFACLEVVLDRGERLDWFESNFIVGFFVVAIAALVFALVWELKGVYAFLYGAVNLGSGRIVALKL